MGAALACTALGTLLAASPLAARAQGTGTAFTSLNSFPGLVSGAAVAPYYTANLTLGADGNFYGTRSLGGTHSDGTIFKETPTGTLTTLYNFADGSDGEYPFGQLVQANSGLFYGVTSTTVFSVSGTGTVTTLHTFASATEGTAPAGGLVMDSSGNLYGTTSTGGANDAGTIFEITPAGALTVLYSFTALAASSSSTDGFANTDGAYPNSPITIGTDGNFYGTTFRGGANDYGTVYKLSAGTLTTLYSFDAGTDGAQSDGSNSGTTVIPIGPLVQAGNGSFYGTAEVGANGTGVVYSITSAGILTSLYQFDATPFSSGNSSDSNVNDTGADPVGGLIIGSDGALYGSTEFGGTNGVGLLFRLTTSGTYNILHTFAAPTSSTNSTNTDGDYPAANLVKYTDGSLYGATSLGGSHGTGTLFKLVPGTFTTTPTTETRFDFNGDGHADLIWYNTGSGDLSVWDMNDQTVLQFGATFTSLAPSTGWQPVAAPDVNNDGVPDLIWWNSQTGELSAWTLTSGAPPSVASFGSDFATLSDTTWKPVAAGDVTGTTWELVFQNTTSGDISRWLMNGTTVVSYGGTLGTVGAGTGWQCVGAPDLDGDGKSDLLFWNSQTGEVSYWSTDLNAGTVLAYHGDFAQVSDTTWHLQGSEDTNGDGHADLIWWNATSGDESRWLLSGTTVTQYGSTDTQVIDTTWQPTAIR